MEMKQHISDVNVPTWHFLLGTWVPMTKINSRDKTTNWPLDRWQRYFGSLGGSSQKHGVCVVRLTFGHMWPEGMPPFLWTPVEQKNSSDFYDGLAANRIAQRRRGLPRSRQQGTLWLYCSRWWSYVGSRRACWACVRSQAGYSTWIFACWKSMEEYHSIGNQLHRSFTRQQ